MERRPSRYAHNVGHTDICYSLDGEKIITCGSDGDIRIWSDLEDVDPVQTCVGEWALCVRQKSDHLFIATDNNNVQLVAFPEGQRDGILVKFTAHVNHIALRKEHDLVAVAAEDMEVRVLDVTDKSKSYSFVGLTGPPLSVAVCPEGKILAVSCGDCHLRVWEIETQVLVKDLSCVPKTNSFMNAKNLCRMDFHPSTTSRQLAYPHESSVVILNTSDWSEKIKLSCHSLKSPYSIVQYSPTGSFLAGSTLEGEIVIWNVSQESVVGVTTHPTKIAICAMMWSPKDDGSIAFCDVHGQISEVINCSNIENEHTATVDDILDDIESYKDTPESDDEDNENVFSLEKLKQDIMGPCDLDSDHGSIPRTDSPRPRTPVVPMQSAFMPTSTPHHLNPRYLCWNEVGIVRSYSSTAEDDSDGGNSIEVEFHDATFHNSMMIPNYHGYNMATLSTSALAVANTSQLSVIPLNSGVKEWIISVPEDEEIVGIAASSKTVVFATNNYLARVCTTHGVQRAVFSIPGPLVTLAAHENSLLIAYHGASPRNSDQCIGMIHVKLNGTKMCSTDIGSALGPDATLLYVGFSDVGTPAMQNSTGMLYLYPQHCNIWVPVCDTAKHQAALSDGFFVTAIDEKLQSVRGIRCRGSVYPTFVPRPVLCELPLQPPFAEMSTEKSQLESSLFAWSCLRVENVERKYKETALKSFALACKSGLDQRAIELVEMLNDPQLLNLAVKYATKMNNRRLVDKLTAIVPSLCEDAVEECDKVNNSLVNVTPNRTTDTMRLPSRKLSVKSGSKWDARSNRVETPPLQRKRTPNVIEDGAPSSTEESQVPETPINTQESLFEEDKPSPFSKRLKQVNENSEPNPLNMSDRFAGLNYQTKKQKRDEEVNVAEKRKRVEAAVNGQKQKQRKLEGFVVSRKT